MGIAMLAGMFLLRNVMATPSLPDTVPGGPDYATAAHTRVQVAKWSKTALIAAGYWNNETNSMTPAFYALPQR